MPDFLLELFSEEIPARMQLQAVKDLERLIVGALSDRGLMFESARAFAGPRRLTLAIGGLPGKQPDVSEEKKGPRVNAPAKAIEGFLRSAGVTLDDCQKRDDGKGEYYLAVISLEGRPTGQVLQEVLPDAIAKLPWPKSMRWGTGGHARWVRPLHGIVCTFEGEVLDFSFANVRSSNKTLGHRFLSSGPISVRRFEDYQTKLHDAYVIVDANERRDTVLHDVRQKAFALGLDLVEDDGLLDEVAGLAEWPVVLVGSIEDRFMELPAEILQTSMRRHQKYFSLRDGKTGTLANRFAVVSNMVPADDGGEIVNGNERVLRARLADAKFFWDQDRKTRLSERVDALAGIVFHARLGTQLERVRSIETLAGDIAPTIGADAGMAKRAARLCKADLTTEVVGEFPELQGIMGRYYAIDDGEDKDVAAAISDHYKPLGPSDEVPKAPISIAVSLADKLHTLFAFFAVGEKPTGSGDPYALRRAALGVMRTILQNNLRIDLAKLRAAAWSETLQLFMLDRLSVVLRNRGIRHDVLGAVFSAHQDADFVRLVARTEAAQEFLKSDDGANLLVAYRRAANILRAEEKKDGTKYDADPDPEVFVAGDEKTLFVELATAGELVRAEVARERFVDAMRVMARLRRHVDLFFDKVTVNAPEAELRRNRLRLLSRLRSTLHLVADFSKIEG
jgi:glycyl-tRNA synthetase beta chain